MSAQRDSELLAEFLSEANEQLAGIGDCVLGLGRESPALSGDAAERLSRALRTLAQGAVALKLGRISAVAGELGELTEKVGSGRIAADAAVSGVLALGIATLKRLVEHPEDETIAIEDEMAALQAVAVGGPPAKAPSLLALWSLALPLGRPGGRAGPRVGDKTRNWCRSSLPKPTSTSPRWRKTFSPWSGRES